jgi:hypothetical protein
MKKPASKEELQLVKKTIYYYVFYLFVWIVIFAFIDWYLFVYSGFAINSYILFFLSILLGGISTYQHLKFHTYNIIDRMLEKFL